MNPDQQKKINETIAQINQTSTQLGQKMGQSFQQLTALGSDSTTARAEVDALGSTITGLESGMSAPTFTDEDEKGIRDAGKATTNLLEQRRSDLASRALAEEDLINQLFNEAQGELEGRQEKEFAGRSTQLITAGGYLGSTQSQQGVLANLAQSHRAEVSALTLKKLASIQGARSAYEDRDFDLAEKIAQEAQATENAIIQARQDFADQAIKVQKENREQTKFQQDVADDTISTIISSGLLPSENDITELAKMKGVAPEIMKLTINNLQKVEAAKTEKEQLASLKTLADVARAFPAGTQIPLPDGSTMTAIGSSGDISISHVADVNGYVRQITTNKMTRSQQVTNLGQIGKPSAGGGSSGYRFTNAQTGALISTGFNQQDVQGIQNDLNQNGGHDTIQNIQNNPTMTAAQKSEAVEAVTKLLEKGFGTTVGEFSFSLPDGEVITSD